MSKSAYFLLPFLYFLIPIKRANSRLNYYLIGAGVVFFAVAGGFIWGKVIEKIYVPFVPGGGFSSLYEAKFFIFSDPLSFANMVIQNLSINQEHYKNSFVGNLGWLDTPIADSYVKFFFWFLFAMTILDGGKDVYLRLSKRISVFFIFLGSTILIIASQFFIWTKIGSTSIGQAQGRYFIPIAPVCALALLNSKLPAFLEKKNIGLLIDLLAVLISFRYLILTVTTIIERYYG